MSDLTTLFRTIWSLGPAGVSVPFAIVRDGERMGVTVESVDRNDCLKSASVH